MLAHRRVEFAYERPVTRIEQVRALIRRRGHGTAVEEDVKVPGSLRAGSRHPYVPQVVTSQLVEHRQGIDAEDRADVPLDCSVS
jgi:hypothetical protein